MQMCIRDSFKKIEELGGVNPRFPSRAGDTISTREVNPIQTDLVDNLGLPEPLVRQIGCVIGTPCYRRSTSKPRV